jgi:hypothetical protein
VFVPEYCTPKGKCAAYGDLIQQSNNRLLRLTAKGYVNKTASVRQALIDTGLPTVRYYAQHARLHSNRVRMEGKNPQEGAADSFGEDNLAAQRRRELARHD